MLPKQDLWSSTSLSATTSSGSSIRRISVKSSASLASCLASSLRFLLVTSSSAFSNAANLIRPILLTSAASVAASQHHKPLHRVSTKASVLSTSSPRLPARAAHQAGIFGLLHHQLTTCRSSIAVSDPISVQQCSVSCLVTASCLLL
ncbi:hypothetical protein NPIL_43941 [Nephila pilipes]|uniref:Uncharacterized protein n=1 Tax=Nephila pilipes TaxID=299642 RepID=A0A8X6INJ8_NEPPI|nr:hypothetical protein NPIL_43941 [Nephila pilipes]